MIEFEKTIEIMKHCRTSGICGECEGLSNHNICANVCNLSDEFEDILILGIDGLKQSNEQLRQTLMECNPFTAHNGRQLNVCEFCREKEHKDDCEYVKLIGGNENG